jgi:acetyl-CoA synthetase
VAEAAVVSKPDSLVGEAIVAFVTLKSGFAGDDTMAGGSPRARGVEDREIARPHGIIFTADLPKPRSGKIMRRVLRDVAHGRALGDVTTLANAEIVERIRDMAETSAAEE